MKNMKMIATCAAFALGLMTASAGQMYYNRLSTGNVVVPAGSYGDITVPADGLRATTMGSSKGDIPQSSGDYGGSFANIIKVVSGDTDTHTHTVSGWFKVAHPSSGEQLLYAAVSYQNNDHGGYMVRINSSGNLRVGKMKTSTWEFNGGVSQSTGSVPNDAWFYLTVVVTKDSSARKASVAAYVNGAAFAMSSDKIDTNLAGENCANFYLGAKLSAAGIYVDTTAVTDTATIKSWATNATYVKPVTPSKEMAYLWLDASDAASITKGGDNVTQWKTRSTSGKSAKSYSAGGVTKGPTVTSGALAGKNVVDFGSNTSGMDLTFDQATNIRTVFMVADVQTGTQNVFFLGDDSAYNFHRGPNGTYFEKDHGKLFHDGTYCDGEKVADPKNTQVPSGYHVYSLVASGDATASRICQDRGGENKTRIGGKRIAELIIFTEVLTDAQRQAIEQYLTDKWITTQYTATVSGEVAWSNLEWTPPGGGSPISTADLPESSEIHVTISSGATLTITSADVAQLTEKKIAFKTSQFTNNGTIKFTGGEKSDPIALTVDGDANIDLGAWALAADTYVKVTANGNKLYTVSGEDTASSFLEITSASTTKGVGTTEGTTFRTMTLVANVDVSSETDGFWIERANSFDATVNLVAAQRIILYENAQTIGSLSGGGTIDRYRDGETHRYTLTITPNADAAFTGASEHPIVIASAAGTQTIKAAKLTNNVTLDAGAKLNITGTPGLEAYVITSATFTDNGGTLTLNGTPIAEAGYKVIGNKLVKVYAKTIDADAKWSELWQGESLPSSAKVVLTVDKSAKLDFDTDITVESITIQSEAGAELTLALSGSLLQAKWDFSAAAGGVSLDVRAMDGEALARYAIAGAPYSAWLIRSEDITAGDLPAAPTAYPTLPTHYSVLASEQVAGVGVRLVIGADETVVRASVNVNIGNPGLDGLTTYGLHPALGTIWYEYYYTEGLITKYLSLKTGYITVPGSSVQITPNEYYLIDTLEKTTDEQKIFKHNMQDSAGAERGFTLKGISGFAAEYRVIVYMSSDTPNWGFAPVTISENMSGTFNPVTYAGPTFQKNEVGYTIKGSKAAHWGWANNESHCSFDQAEGVNAIVSDVMTADNIVIKALRPSDDALMARGSIAAIQIVKLDRDDPDAVSVTYGTAGNRLRLTTTDYRKWDTAVVPGNPTAARKSERTDRTAYVGKPTSVGGLTGRVKVFEHPELNYTQYEMTLSNSTAAAINVVAFNLWSGWTPTQVGEKGDGRINGGTQGPVVQFPSDKTYFGVENPQTDISVTDGRASAVLARNYAIKAGEMWTVRWVVGTYSEESQLRREFQAYLDNERAHPYRVFPHYNSWYDLCIGHNDETDPKNRLTEEKLMTAIKKFRQKLSVERGCWMKSYLADDGWDNWYSVWDFHTYFPDGFKNVADEIHKDAGASISCWMSPCGGYGGSFNQRLQYAKDKGYVPQSASVLRLSQDGYYAPFRDRAIKMITDYDMNLFKFDRMGSGGDCTGAGSEYAPDIAAVVRLTQEMRAKKQDVFINCTVGTWASPFWVMYADSIWRGEGDYGGQGGKYTIGDTVRQRWITYRDNVIYNRFANPNPLFPLNSMMNHGIIVTKNGTDGTAGAWSSEDTDATLQDFCDEMWMSMACGTDLQEYYISPDLMFDRWWDALATGIKWLEANQETLRDVHWVGGDPFNERYGQSTSGKQGAIYGYASWKGTKGIIVLRNSHSSTLSLTTTIANLLELPSTCDTPTVASVKRVFSHNADLSTYFKKPKTVYENVTFTLPRYDVMLIEVELSQKPRGLMLFTK